MSNNQEPHTVDNIFFRQQEQKDILWNHGIILEIFPDTVIKTNLNAHIHDIFLFQFQYMVLKLSVFPLNPGAHKLLLAKHLSQ